MTENEQVWLRVYAAMISYNGNSRFAKIAADTAIKDFKETFGG
jgi:hypothetical protein